MTTETETDDLLAEVGNWNEDYREPKGEGDGDGERNRIGWMKFEKPGKYTVRLVGKYVRFLRHWEPFTERVIGHPSYKGKDPAWKAGFYPKKTYAIHMIDRSDGKLKILEKGNSIFETLINFKVENDISPSDAKEGSDVVIHVQWPEGKKRNAKYKVTILREATPLTDEEKTMIKANGANLKAMYKSTPLEKIIELWDALPDDAKKPKPREKKNAEDSSEQQTPKAPVSDDMEGAPADGDDIFGDEGSDENSDW